MKTFRITETQEFLIDAQTPEEALQRFLDLPAEELLRPDAITERYIEMKTAEGWSRDKIVLEMDEPAEKPTGGGK